MLSIEAPGSGLEKADMIEAAPGNTQLRPNNAAVGLLLHYMVCLDALLFSPQEGYAFAHLCLAKPMKDKRHVRSYLA